MPAPKPQTLADDILTLQFRLARAENALQEISNRWPNLSLGPEAVYDDTEGAFSCGLDEATFEAAAIAGGYFRESLAEKAARSAGWDHGGDNAGVIFNRGHFSSWKEAVSWSGEGEHEGHRTYSTWIDCCEGENIPFAPTVAVSARSSSHALWQAVSEKLGFPVRAGTRVVIGIDTMGDDEDDEKQLYPAGMVGTAADVAFYEGSQGLALHLAIGQIMNVFDATNGESWPLTGFVESSAMSFDDFVASGRDVPDLGVPLQDLALENAPGRLYLNALYIEKRSDQWHLLISRVEWNSIDRQDLEPILYLFAESEGYFEPPVPTSIT